MVVIRIEDVTKAGPYRSRREVYYSGQYPKKFNHNLQYFQEKVHNNNRIWDTRPNLLSDSSILKDAHTENHSFGFADWKQFINWFSTKSELKWLDFHKFNVYYYETDEFVSSEYQAIFDQSRAKCVKKISWSTIYGLYGWRR